MLADKDVAQAAPSQAALTQAEAVQAVAASARRLFPLVSEQQARNLATSVLHDLKAQGIGLVRNRASDG